MENISLNLSDNIGNARHYWGKFVVGQSPHKLDKAPMYPISNMVRVVGG
jgi:hypothetical protein